MSYDRDEWHERDTYTSARRADREFSWRGKFFVAFLILVGIELFILSGLSFAFWEVVTPPWLVVRVVVLVNLFISVMAAQD